MRLTLNETPNWKYLLIINNNVTADLIDIGIIEDKLVISTNLEISNLNEIGRKIDTPLTYFNIRAKGATSDLSVQTIKDRYLDWENFFNSPNTHFPKDVVKGRKLTKALSKDE